MRVKVRPYKLILEVFDSTNGAYYRKENTGSMSAINIYCDENMYINPNSTFKDDLGNVLDKFTSLPITQRLCYEIEHHVDLLLKTYREKNLLFLESDMLCRIDREWLVLWKESLFENY